MGVPNEDFSFETEVDLDNIDEKTAEAALARANKTTQPEIEVAAEETKLPVEKKVEKTVEEDPTDEELASYSESVQKRIKKLTFEREQARREAAEAARAKEEAFQFAQQTLQERRALEEQAQRLGEQSVSALSEKLTADIAATRKEYVEAANSYDTEAMADAQMKLADLVAQKRELDAKKSARPVAQTEKPVVQQQASTRPAPDTRAQEWVARNSAWFQKDKAMTAFAFGVHEDLVEKGVDPRTEPEAYYGALDKAVKSRFPEMFTETPDSTPTRRTSPVAPATRSTTGRQRVTLTATELARANRLGVTPEAYAREKLKLENRNV